ncbi:hypothetical protein TWF694_010919 [Orbilia ellipsospora]|uniref:Uncharacterized protein n=1 Tax=Orbilia ellipsospora TaxID=2528407 RepID=A0AAV9X8U0_9PEZI
MPKNGSKYANPAFAGLEDTAGGGDRSDDDTKVSEYVPETTSDRFVRQIANLRQPRRYRSSETLVPEGYEGKSTDSRSSSIKRSSSAKRRGSLDDGPEEVKLIDERYRSQEKSDNGDGDDPNSAYARSRAKRSKLSSIGIMILVLSIFSTVFSILFFMIATVKPRYQHYIHATGTLSPNSASLLSAIFAKAIEISFTTVFTSFVGQVLSKRAFRRNSNGIRIADLLMKQWVYQPGTMFTTIPALRYAGGTVMGAVIFFVVLCVTLYTTAADTLVSPKLAFGKYYNGNLRGVVSLTYANSTALASRCPAIISTMLDGPMNGSALPVSQSTCYKVHNSYQPLRDFTFYTDTWTAYRADMSIPRADFMKRPTGWTTVGNDRYYGSWLEVKGEVGLNNVTLAMPHGGFVPAVRNLTLNGLVQPDAQSDFGNVDATASVVSPAINVLCYKLNATTAQWFIANGPAGPRRGTLDPEVQRIFNFDPDPSQLKNISSPGLYLAPVFATAPQPFNVAIFSSAGYDDPSMYAIIGANATAPSYSLCALRSILTSSCSTNYLSATGGGNITVNCSPDNPQALSRFLSSAHDTYQSQFKDISTELAYALSINVQDAPLSRILGIFASSPAPIFDPAIPSPAEAFAILFSNSVTLSSVGAQFGTNQESNDYTGVSPYPIQLPTLETFQTRIRTVEYASGVQGGAAASFYVILAGVMVVNLFCLVYFFVTKDLVFDFTEIENLFCVAYNSRGATVVADDGTKRDDGFYGKGPRGKDFAVGFHVDCEEDERFFLYKQE